MLDTAAIATALTGLVGWRPDPAGKVELPGTLTTSKSGLYVQDASELLTLDVLSNVVPRGETMAAWLLRLQSDALTRLISELIGAQKVSGKALLSDGLDSDGNPAGIRMVKNPGNKANTVNKLGRFVGVQLSAPRRNGVAVEVPGLSIQLDAALTDSLTLYLYNETQPDPIKTFEVPVGNRAYYPFPVALEGLSLAGKSWLGYYEDDLPLGVHAIEAPIGPCGCADDPYPKWSEQLTAKSFTQSAVQLVLNDGQFDPLADVTLEEQNFGLNLLFLSYCSIASVLTSKANTANIAPLVQQAFAVRMLEALYGSPNVTQVTGRSDVQADCAYQLFRLQAKLYGGKVPGTDEVYPSALQRLTLDLSGLDAACGPPKYSPLSMGRLER
jgi:hypothetical protein